MSDAIVVDWLLLAAQVVLTIGYVREWTKARELAGRVRYLEAMRDPDRIARIFKAEISKVVPISPWIGERSKSGKRS